MSLYVSNVPCIWDKINPLAPMRTTDYTVIGKYFIWHSWYNNNSDNQFSSVSHVQLCNSMNCSMPGLPVHHQLPEFTQTHVHWVTDAIQPSHPLLSLSPPALILPSIQVFSNESAFHIRWPMYWSFSFNISPSNEHPGPVSFRVDWLDPLQSKGLESSPKPQFKSINSSVLSFLYNPTLTLIHDYWKNHSLD